MQRAFDHVVTAHGGAVLRVCRALVGPDDADDVWAETFVSAMRAYPELPHDANVEAWLVTIARRKGIDHLRARARRALPVETVPERPETAGLGSPNGSTCTPRSRRCPPASGSASPSTTWVDCPTPRSPPCSAGPRQPHVGLPPTGCERSARHSLDL